MATKPQNSFAAVAESAAADPAPVAVEPATAPKAKPAPVQPEAPAAAPAPALAPVQPPAPAVRYWARLAPFSRESGNIVRSTCTRGRTFKAGVWNEVSAEDAAYMGPQRNQAPKGVAARNAALLFEIAQGDSPPA